ISGRSERKSKLAQIKKLAAYIRSMAKTLRNETELAGIREMRLAFRATQRNFADDDAPCFVAVADPHERYLDRRAHLAARHYRFPRRQDPCLPHSVLSAGSLPYHGLFH